MEEIRALLDGSGWNPVFPVDLLPDGTPMDISGVKTIQSHCLAHLDACEAILAEVSPWYGHQPDAGTVFEIGYAAAKGLEVILWTDDPTPLRDRLTLDGQIQPNPDEPSDANLHDRYGNIVEDFGSPVNAMLAVYPLYPGVFRACEKIRSLSDKSGLV